MDIIRYRYEWQHGKLVEYEVPLSFIYTIVSGICRCLFEVINHAHYKNTKYKTIKIYGIRTALVESGGQRSTTIFYWKIGKRYI